MKNILYITYVDYFENAFPGVQAKILDQMEAFKEAGYHVDRVNQYGKSALLVDGDSGDSVQYQSFTKRFAIYKAVKEAVSKRYYTGTYIRFQFFSEDLRRILTLIHSKETKIIIEIPTYPYEAELRQQGVKGIIKLSCDRLYRNLCINYVDKFTTFSDDKSILDVSCINLLNGLDFSKHPLRKINKPQHNKINLIAVATMMRWQGYDRLLNGLAEYYKVNRDIDITLHLVGEGNEIQNYKKIIDDNILHKHVIMHGMKQGEELNSIASMCDLAVGSLGSFRRPGVKCLSTLKSREYCAWGFPSINATNTDILSRDDPFCLYVPEKDEYIDFNEIVLFFHRVYFESEMTADEIAANIRSKAEKQSDIHTVFRPVVEYFG